MGEPIGEEEKAKLKEVFDSFDADGSGAPDTLHDVLPQP